MVSASLSFALASASFATALFSDPPRGFTLQLPRESSDDGSVQIGVYWERDILGRVTSLSWSSDKYFLIATFLFGLAGLGASALAVRRR
jgi:hypothetical protein